jgi:hypothetical protein
MVSRPEPVNRGGPIQRGMQSGGEDTTARLRKRRCLDALIRRVTARLSGTLSEHHHANRLEEYHEIQEHRMVLHVV